MSKRRDPLPRLNIAPNLAMQQPMGGPNGGMYSPALPTSIQQSFHPSFPMANPLQTPMQSFFTGVPGAPARPMHPHHHQQQQQQYQQQHQQHQQHHHAHQASIQLAAAGIHPPGFQMQQTPVTSHFPRPSMSLMLGQGQGQGGVGPGPSSGHGPFPNRNRRQLSVGGPPKAVLGGPQRKLSPLPAAAAATAPSTGVATPAAGSTTPAPPVKTKKMIVNLPKESGIPVAGVEGEGEDGAESQPATRVPEWARSPLAVPPKNNEIPVPPADISTAEIYPPDEYKLSLPDVIDVYLPGKTAWDAIKQKDIEEKLARLGVERGSGSNIPHIHAPHARAASISSPADPALLLFKLNKLQKSQDASAANSLSASPQPPSLTSPFGLSPSPHFINAAANRHGHSMSMAQGPSYRPYSASPSLNFNPFGMNAVLGSDSMTESVASASVSEASFHMADPIHAPQGRVPMAFAPPLSAVGGATHVDFIRGFGLDVPLESEEEGEEDEEQDIHALRRRREQEDEDEVDDGNEEDGEEDMELEDRFDGDGETSEIDDSATTAPQSRMHSRHVSKLSAALSLRSVGGNFQAQFPNPTNEVAEQEEQVEVEQEDEGAMEERQIRHELEVDPVEEWTGSEDVYLEGGTSDDESIGEWSNPSDEERARQERVERRMRRRTRQQNIDQPRRLPNFPRPPETALNFLPSHQHHEQDDDIISNPSEENMPLGVRRAEFLGVTTEEYYPNASLDVAPANPFRLPPSSHSRGPSSQYSIHDPARAHSRDGSDSYGFALGHQTTLSGERRRESLNPHAKPFVFGQPRAAGSGSWPQQPQHQHQQQSFGSMGMAMAMEDAEPSMPMPIAMPSGSGGGSATFSPEHTRLPSLGKPLNVAAPEFKPGAFSFRLSGAPSMPVPEPLAPTFAFPQPQHHHNMPSESAQSSPFKVQGREKRQKRLSADGSVVEEGDSIASFKFPMKLNTSSPNIHHRRRSRSLSASTDGGEEDEEVEDQDDPVLQPFTFAGFNKIANNMPWVPKEVERLDLNGVEGSMEDSSTAKGDTTAEREREDEDEEEEEQEEMALPAPPTKQKRAPIPLDFKHPVSSNTVPAGLFKALISSNNEERTRRSVRSRLDSREIFEHSHRPSMDDNNVALIAQQNNNTQRTRLVTDPGERPTPLSDDDVFGSVRHARRRSSLPDAFVDTESPLGAESEDGGAQEMQMLALQHMETVFAQLLDEKLGELRREIRRREHKTEGNMLETAEEVISMFRAQLQESASRSLEDSRLDARGELDFQMLREIVEDGHRHLLDAFQHQLHQELQNATTSTTSKGVVGIGSPDVIPAVEELGRKTVNAVVEAISELSVRQEAVSLNAPAVEHDLIVDKLVSVLSPMLNSLHNDPIDYDFLTRELTQSVKPHISQLIDLASDKRETAGLIVERILPHLTALKPVPVDTDAITLKLITEVRKAIAPIDAFEIKEQVADLVVERLDSRLAVRDKASDGITLKATETVAQLLESVDKMPAAIDKLASGQKATEDRQIGIADVQSQILASVAGIPSKVEPQLEQVKALQNDILSKLDQPAAAAEPDANILLIKDIVEALSLEQKKLAEHGEGSISQTKTILDRLADLPESFTTTLKGIESSLTELITSRDSTKRELEELRKLNTEYQIQLTKARGSHGQVRVEKDVLAEKLGIIEADRDRLRTQTKELQTAASTKTAETTALQARNAELEDALAKALSRLQSADVVTQANKQSIADLEVAKKDLSAENQELKSKVDSLDREVAFANKEKDNASNSLAVLQAKYDALASQQSNWEALTAATEKINLVFNLLENADSEEQKELRHYRDHSKALEEQNANMQKHFKDIEAKLVNSERSAAALRQTMSQAQQRSEEWERLAKDAQGKAEMLETQLEQAQQTHSQLDADYQFVTMQLEEKDADSRLQADRTTKLQQQITALESKCVLLQGELEKANSKQLSTAAPPFRPRTNGNILPPARPDSRASTIYDGRTDTASNRRMASYTSARSSVISPSVNEPSVRDSMHAPSSTNATRQWAQASAASIVHTPVSRYASLAPTTPKAHHASPYSSQIARGPSPTPSTVSAVPTQGDDGWWS